LPSENLKKYPTEVSSRLFDSLESEPFFDPSFPSMKPETKPTTPPLVVVESPETKEPVEVQSEATKIVVDHESVPQCSHPEKKVEAVEVVSEEIILPTAGSSLCDTPPAVMEVPEPEVSDVTEESPLDVPTENPPLRPKKSDLDEFEDFLETIDKDLIGDISPQSLSVARPNGNPGVGLEGEPNTAEKKSSEPLLQENKELKKQVYLLPLPSLTFSRPTGPLPPEDLPRQDPSVQSAAARIDFASLVSATAIEAPSQQIDLPLPRQPRGEHGRVSFQIRRVSEVLKSPQSTEPGRGDL
jgi:hypothetical protein